MNKLQLLDDENIIEKYDNVYGYPEGDCHGGELYITTQNLIFWYETGIFNSIPHIVKTPLSKIKNANGTYNIKYNEEEEIVEIFYAGGQDEFSFDEEETAMKFIKDLENCLNKGSLVNSIQKSKVEKNEEYICNKCGQKNDFSSKYCNNCGANLHESKSMDVTNLINKKSINKKNKCKSCGAILNGNIGQTVKCEYCDFIQIIE